jgi:transcriptional regulator with XRE-family HTH domain
MTKDLQDLWNSLPEDRKQHLEKDYQAMKAEYLTLQELRKSLSLTQTDVAETLNVNQVNISKLENRSDLKISTLQDFISALGGDLEMVVRFSDRPPVILKGFGQLFPLPEQNPAH